MHICPSLWDLEPLPIHPSYTLSSTQTSTLSPFSTTWFFLVGRRSCIAFRQVPWSVQKDQNCNVLREGICLTLLTQGQRLPTRSLVRTFTKHNDPKCKPHTLRMYTNVVCKHKTCNFEYKLPTLQMDWEILYVAFLWITPHKPTWRSLQNAKSCPQCLDILYLYMPMLEHLYIQWKTRGWFYLSGEWCERSCGFAS